MEQLPGDAHLPAGLEAGDTDGPEPVEWTCRGCGYEIDAEHPGDHAEDDLCSDACAVAYWRQEAEAARTRDRRLRQALMMFPAAVGELVNQLRMATVATKGASDMMAAFAGMVREHIHNIDGTKGEEPEAPGQ